MIITGKLYNFTRLINKYSNTFTLTSESGGEYIDGVWRAGETVTEYLRGAIVPMPQKKIYQSGGNYSSEDRELYMITRIPSALLGGKVLYKGNTYSIEEETEWDDYAGAFHYVLKRECVG